MFSKTKLSKATLAFDDFRGTVGPDHGLAMRAFFATLFIGLGLVGMFACVGLIMLMLLLYEKSPRLDATNEHTVFVSIAAMTQKMTHDQSTRFEEEIREAALGYTPDPHPPLLDDRKNLAERLKPLHGMTAAQIHRKAQQEVDKWCTRWTSPRRLH